MFFGGHLFAQVHINKPKNYYEKFHFGYHEKIYTYYEDYLSYLVDSTLLYNNYLDLDVLNISKNVKNFYQDEEGIFLPDEIEDYENAIGFWSNLRFDDDSMYILIYRTFNEDGEIVNTEKSRRAGVFYSRDPDSYYDSYDFDLLVDSIPNSLLDTILIVRNPPVDYSLIDELEQSNVSHGYYEEIELITLDMANPNSEKYLDLLVEVQVELYEGDLLSRNLALMREVVNPHRITNKMIQRMSISLQELGYLSGSANRYVPDIRNAITELQLDHNLPVGFLDQKTFEVLNLEFTDQYCRCVKDRLLCFPASLKRSYVQERKHSSRSINTVKRRYK